MLKNKEYEKISQISNKYGYHYLAENIKVELEGNTWFSIQKGNIQIKRFI